MKIQINPGDKYGLLTITREVEPYIYSDGKKHRKFEAKCECGNFKTYRMPALRIGATTSCGCYKKERSTTHGLSNHPTYRVWRDILQRCSNPKHKHFKDYGGRGINVCDEWRNSFETFYNDMSNGYAKGLDIDRIDNDKGYSKENCRWVTHRENCLNRRISGNINYRGVYFHKEARKYVAQVTRNKIKKHIGIYVTALEAAHAYDDFVKANNLPNQLNF